MIDTELGSTWTRLGLVVLSSGSMLLGTITYVRIIGLRSFSKMSSFDFAVTVAVGSLLASVSLSRSSLAEGLLALVALLGLQAMIAWLRLRGFGAVIDNDPLLLMVGDQMIEEHLRRSRVSAADVRAKLREANVADYSQIGAVVLETTGDISVIHHCDTLDPALLEGVVGVDRLRSDPG